MAGPRADWFVSQLSVDELDLNNPFDAPVEEIGEVIELGDRTAVLSDRLVQLLARENFLSNKGTTCAIKDAENTCCYACPVSQAHDLKTHLGPLCRIGREEEEVITELAALRHNRVDP